MLTNLIAGDDCYLPRGQQGNKEEVKEEEAVLDGMSHCERVEGLKLLLFFC